MSVPRRLAFGVDPIRAEKFSLRQSRYHGLSEVVSQLALKAQQAGQPLRVLDVGVQDGVSRRYLEVQPGAENIEYSGADLTLRDFIYRRESWKDLFTGDLMQGYPQIPSETYDVVVCEQVLEHLTEQKLAMQTLVRALKPGGTLIVGVPTFPHGFHLIRKYLVPLMDSVNPWGKRDRGHVQAFSRISFCRLLRRNTGIQIMESRGYRIVSGGLLRPLENFRWWWKFNRQLGALLPDLCIEIQVIAKKSEAKGEVSPRPLRRSA